MKKSLLSLLALVLLTTAVFALDRQGKDVVAAGTYRELQGTLYSEEGEYYLKTASGLYSIHLGPEWFSGEIGFKPEMAGYAVISGFVLEGDVAPSSIKLAENVYTFRQEDGHPLWSGRGNRQNQHMKTAAGAGLIH